jgi:hypothetical protein
MYSHESQWTPFQTHYFSGNLVTPRTKTGTSASAARNFDPWFIVAVKQ